ncbi:hypothetical protein G647_09330 [Cladophialophora carrionii CBS 160.54]|uniref:FAD-binding PCMH-type domain-containing protein n=1 Tax=Cladophialophora carrionii CBS 160.54 TaxID=1279043 RepID=V9CYP4_9EURO|nr:uncharacterized protein G647_09330 [Cladophialophora carrionii CBS 160.54]ETI19496.1 hypothetical protein G647_09330 [Cladophialophora carrionii CBS 160.54]
MASLLTPHPLVVDLLKQPDLTVLTASSPDWDKTRATYFIDNPAQPIAIARPRNAEQVSTFVKAARSHGVKISVRVGGHDVAGRSVVDGCFVLDLREINFIEVSEDKQTATIGGGILIGDVIKTLTPRELVTPFGYFPTIGYAGWAMMGGYGWLASRFGLGVDQIERARVVTAQGGIVEADAELLKGIRGAGGNFGVIVELGIRIYPLEKLLAGTILFLTSDSKASVQKYFAGYNAMTKSPYGGCGPFWFPKQDDLSQWMFGVNFLWSSNDMDAGRQYLQQVAALGDGADTSLVRETTPVELIDLISAWSPPRSYGRNAGNAVSFQSITARPAKVIGDFLSKAPVDTANVLLIHEMRGQSAEPHPDSCFGARLPHGVIELIGVVINPANIEASTQRYRELYEGLKGTGDALDVTYASLTQTRDTQISKLFGSEYQFVIDLKNKYDPEGLFDNTEPRLRP